MFLVLLKITEAVILGGFSTIY